MHSSTYVMQVKTYCSHQIFSTSNADWSAKGYVALLICRCYVFTVTSAILLMSRLKVFNLHKIFTGFKSLYAIIFDIHLHHFTCPNTYIFISSCGVCVVSLVCSTHFPLLMYTFTSSSKSMFGSAVCGLPCLPSELGCPSEDKLRGRFRGYILRLDLNVLVRERIDLTTTTGQIPPYRCLDCDKG